MCLFIFLSFNISGDAEPRLLPHLHVYWAHPSWVGEQQQKNISHLQQCPQAGHHPVACGGHGKNKALQGGLGYIVLGYVRLGLVRLG